MWYNICMKTKNFNKLVRDRIPEIIEQSNRKVFMKILDDDEFINELVIKRNEEFRTRRGYS